MPATKLRQKLKIFWPRTKLVVLLLSLFLIGVGLIVTGLPKFFGKNPPPTVLATAPLLSNDEQLSEIAAFLASAGVTPSNPKIENNLILFWLDETEIVLPLNDNLSPKLKLLLRIWQQYKILGQVVKKIDLRFEQPLVSY